MEAKTQEVIITRTIVGEGTDDDPIRYVKQVWSIDGKLIADNDFVYGKSKRL